MAATSRRSKPPPCSRTISTSRCCSSRGADVAPPRSTEVPVVKGTFRSAKGHLGAFELTVDDYAQPAPSSRGALSFGAPRNGAVSRCDIVLDLSGGTPLFTASDLRDGYLRADPNDPAAVLESGAEGARSCRHLRQAALHHIHRRSLRSFALPHRRLQSMPRSLSDRRDRAEWRSCRHRRAYLRRLRPVRCRLSDRRRVVCAAAGRCPDAQAAHHARSPIERPVERRRSCSFTTIRTGRP